MIRETKKLYVTGKDWDTLFEVKIIRELNGSTCRNLYPTTELLIEEDLDDLNHVNNVRYVQWIQDIAKEHWEVRATEQLKKDFIWVVIGMRSIIKSRLF